jgi:hypothetical protein
MNIVLPWIAVGSDAVFETQIADGGTADLDGPWIRPESNTHSVEWNRRCKWQPHR